MDENNKIENKKKQKAGLNAIRPENYIENKFKGMAKERSLSQTELFVRMFWNYIKSEDNKTKQDALNLESEINLIAKDLNNILLQFKTMADKAQNTIISTKTNAAQTEKNLNLDKDSLTKKIEELGKRNKELENYNSAFDEVKRKLSEENQNLIEKLSKKDTELTNITNDNKDKIKIIKNMEKQIASLEKSNLVNQRENNILQEDLKSKETKINALDQSNCALKNTIDTLTNLKESEISAITSKYELEKSQLKSRLNAVEKEKEDELQQIKNHLKMKYESEKNMAVAESKLELADFKNKYNELMAELNAVKQKNNIK